MFSGHFAGDASKSGMELGMALSTVASSFLFDPGALFLILKTNSIFEYKHNRLNII
jgi:hypothetical protein